MGNVTTLPKLSWKSNGKICAKKQMWQLEHDTIPQQILSCLRTGLVSWDPYACIVRRDARPLFGSWETVSSYPESCLKWFPDVLFLGLAVTCYCSCLLQILDSTGTIASGSYTPFQNSSLAKYRKIMVARNQDWYEDWEILNNQYKMNLDIWKWNYISVN